MEVALEATRRLKEYLAKRSVPFRIWLRQTASEQLVKLRRKHVLAAKQTVHRESPLPDHSSIALAHKLMAGRPSQIIQKRELTQQVLAAIGQMGKLDREILLLRHIEELTNQEIAALIEIDSAAVSQRYGRAIIRFREKLISMGITNE